MIYDLSNDMQSENFKLRCNRLYKKKCIVELTEKKPQRTLKQNAYLHVILGYFGLQTGYSIEEVKSWYFKDTCNPELFIRYKTDRITGEQRKIHRSSADLTTEELTLAIERFRNWSAANADIYIPSSEEHRLVLQMEIEVMKGTAYL